MGWWKVEGSSDVIGDGPLDVLGDAVTEVVGQYQSAFSRKPSRAEWEALLTAVLGEDDDASVLDQGTVTRVVVETR